MRRASRPATSSLRISSIRTAPARSITASIIPTTAGITSPTCSETRRPLSSVTTRSRTGGRASRCTALSTIRRRPLTPSRARVSRRAAWRSSRGRLLAEAAVGRLRGAHVEAGIGRVGGRRLALLDVLEEVHRLVAHLEGTLAHLAGGEALLHQIDLHRQGVGNDERQSA